MVLVPKIERQAWQPFRDEIARLYITEDLKLERVMSTMYERHGLATSKAQYSRQLKNWGFTKNVPSTIWTPIARQLEKRKREGKESDVYVNGCLVSSKKVRKEISRHDRPVFVAVPPPAPVSEFYDICTPREKSCDTDELLRSAAALLRGSRVYDVPNTRNLPWIITLELVESQFDFYEQASLDSSISKCLDDSFIMAGVVNADNDCKHPGMNHEETTYRLSPPPHKQLLAREAPIELHGSPHLVSNIVDIPNSDIDAFAFEAIFPRSLFSSTRDRSLTKLFSRLQPFTFEGRQGDLMRCLKAGSSFDHFDKLFRFFSLIIYLSSNSFVDLGYIDQFLEWLVRSGNDWMLGQLMEIRTPTIEMFGTRLLFSAIYLGYSTILQILIDHKIDVNVHAAWREARHIDDFTPLQAAVTKRDVQIVRQLLEAGALVDAIVPFQVNGSDGRALAIATFGANDAALVRMLLEYGADPNITNREELDHETFQVEAINRTALQKSVSRGSAEVVKMLLDAGADPNPWTPGIASPLQRAALRDDVEMVRILLAACAHPNPALGCISEVERAVLIRSISASRAQVLLCTPIQAAVSNNNMEIVQLLLKSGADVNLCLLRGLEQPELINQVTGLSLLPTPLQSAVMNDNLCMLSKLVLAGAHVHCQCCRIHSTSVIHHVATHNRVEAVISLLRLEPDVDGLYVDVRNARTALQSATDSGNLQLVQALGEAGVAVNAAGSAGLGKTALKVAAARGVVEPVDRLLENKVDSKVFVTLDGGLMIPHAAVGYEDLKLVDLFLDMGTRLDISAATLKGQTVLEQSILGAHADMIRFLIGRGAPLDTEASCETTIGEASVAVERPFQGTAVPDSLNRSGDTPHHPAAKSDIIKVVEMLVESGANVDARSNGQRQFTALQCAASATSLSAVSFFLGLGADVNASAGEAGGRTALQAAVETRHQAFRGEDNIKADEAYLVVRFLLERGADPNAPVSANRGVSALEAAMSRKSTRMSVDDVVLHLLISFDVDLNTRPKCDCSESEKRFCHCGASPLQIFARGGGAIYETIELAIGAGADINAPATDMEGTALQGAAHAQRFDVVRLLIQAGADVNAPGYKFFGRTALQEAAGAKNANVAMVRYFLDQGADVNAPASPERGITALQTAAIAGHLHIIQILLEAGADVDAPAAEVDGRTALEGAAEWGRLDTVQFLLNALDHLRDEEVQARCESAAKLATRRHHYVIARFLREHRKKSSWKHLRTEE